MRRRAQAMALLALAAAVPLGEGLALVALALLAGLTASRWRALRPVRLAQTPLPAVGLGLGVWAGAGALALASGSQGWLRPAELGRWVPLLLLPLLPLAATGLSRCSLRRAAGAFVGASLLMAILGLAQVAFNLQLQELWGRGDLANVSQSMMPHDGSRSVAGGLFRHRLKLAHLLVLAALGLQARQLWLLLPRRQRVAELLALAVIWAALAATYARGALFSLVLVGLMQTFGAATAAAAGRRRAARALILAVPLGLALLAQPSVRARLVSSGSAEARAVRGLVWSRAVALAVDHPLGLGLGNYPQAVGAYYDAVEPSFDVRTYPHSLYMAALVETGPVGLLGFVAAWMALALAWARRPGAVAATGLGGVAMLGCLGLTHDVLYHVPVALGFMGLLGWALAWEVADA